MLFLWRRARRTLWRGAFEEIHFLLSIPGHLTLCLTSPHRAGEAPSAKHRAPQGGWELALGCAGKILHLGPLLEGRKVCFGEILRLIRILKSTEIFSLNSTGDEISFEATPNSFHDSMALHPKTELLLYCARFSNLCVQESPKH